MDLRPSIKGALLGLHLVVILRRYTINSHSLVEDTPSVQGHRIQRAALSNMVVHSNNSLYRVVMDRTCLHSSSNSSLYRVTTRIWRPRRNSNSSHHRNILHLHTSATILVLTVPLLFNQMEVQVPRPRLRHLVSLNRHIPLLPLSPTSHRTPQALLSHTRSHTRQFLPKHIQVRRISQDTNRTIDIAVLHLLQLLDTIRLHCKTHIYQLDIQHRSHCHQARNGSLRSCLGHFPLVRLLLPSTLHQSSMCRRPRHNGLCRHRQQYRHHHHQLVSGHQ